MQPRGRIFFLSCALILAFACFGRTSAACSCGAPPTVDIEWKRHSYVGIFRLTSIYEPTAEQFKADGKPPVVRFEAEKIYKGDIRPGEEIGVTHHGGASCSRWYQNRDLGERFLLYLDGDRLRDGPVSKPDLGVVDSCGRSGPVYEAPHDLAFLEKMDAVLGKNRVSGFVRQPDRFRTPFANHKVTLISSDRTIEMRTDKKVSLKSTDCPPGSTH